MTDLPIGERACGGLTVIEEVSAAGCPFCGQSDIRTLKTAVGRWATICWPFSNGCGARTDFQFSSQAARIAWDRRPNI